MYRQTGLLMVMIVAAIVVVAATQSEVSIRKPNGELRALSKDMDSVDQTINVLKKDVKRLKKFHRSGPRPSAKGRMCSCKKKRLFAKKLNACKAKLHSLRKQNKALRTKKGCPKQNATATTPAAPTPAATNSNGDGQCQSELTKLKDELKAALEKKCPSTTPATTTPAAATAGTTAAVGTTADGTPATPAATGSAATTYDSCKVARDQLKAAGQTPKSGVYAIKVGKVSIVELYCDMEYLGGGWTVLIADHPSPIDGGAKGSRFGSVVMLAPGLTIAPEMVVTDASHGINSCGEAVTYQKRKNDRFWTATTYACGNTDVRTRVHFPNWLGATELAFSAAVQGQAFGKLSVNGKLQKPFHKYTSPQICKYYGASTAATKLPTQPGVNGCWNQDLRGVKPKVVSVAEKEGKAPSSINLQIHSGYACQPSCAFGTGHSIRRLMVR